MGDTPSPLDAALYGPSLRRLDLLGRYGQMHTCRSAGIVIAEELDKTLGRLKDCAALVDATTVKRSTVIEWAEALSLEVPTQREVQFLRELLFSSGKFARDDDPPRVLTMLLLLSLSRTAIKPFGSRDVEAALVRGLDLQGKPLEVEPLLSGAHTRWRILSLLKLLRHASELAFAAVFNHVKASPGRFGTAQVAAEDLVARACATGKGGHDLPQRYERLLDDCADTSVPNWLPSSSAAEEMLRHAVVLCAWCHAVLMTDSGQELQKDEMAKVGSHTGAALASYSDQLKELSHETMASVARWLCVDRGVARHFQVAARKLAQHDTFRLIEDEEGIRATDECPLPDIAIRVHSMLSLITDLQLLDRRDDGYSVSAQTEAWYQQEMRRRS